MKTQLLPYHFRKLGLLIFTAMFIPGVIAGVMDANVGIKYNVLSERTLHIMDIIGMVGIIMYALSKEKVYDELLQKLRLEAIKLTFVISIILIFLLHVIFPEFKISPSYLIYLQIMCFALVYYIKKADVGGSEASRTVYE